MVNRLALMLCVLIVAGCCAAPHYTSQPLTKPVRPVLPAVHEGELACLPDDTYRRIVERERLRREYAEKLEAIIQSTHAEGK